MRFNLGLGFNVDHRALGVSTLLATGHADVGALQVVQRQRVGGLVAQVRANLVQGEFCGILELVIAQTECRVK